MNYVQIFFDHERFLGSALMLELGWQAAKWLVYEEALGSDILELHS